MSAGCDTSLGGSLRSFPTTLWTEILNAASDPESRRQFLQTLLTKYWKPIYISVRRHGHANEDAKDLTQDFILHLLEGDTFSRVGRGAAKLRTYLKTALRNFLIDHSRQQKSLKRGGEARRLSLDFDDEESDQLALSTSLSPEQAFDRVWAETLKSHCLRRLKEHLETAGKALYWNIFEEYDLKPHVEELSYAMLARRYGVSEFDVRNHLSFARNLLARLLRESVRESLLPGDEVETEIRELWHDGNVR